MQSFYVSFQELYNNHKKNYKSKDIIEIRHLLTHCVYTLRIFNKWIILKEE